MAKRILQDIDEQDIRLKKAQITKKRVEEARAYCILGDDYYSRGDVHKALEYHKQHWSIVKNVGDRAGERIAYRNLGIDYRSLGDIQRAIEYHEQALSIATEAGEKRVEGCTYGSLGVDYQEVGDFRRAIECHELHLRIAKEFRDRTCEGHAYNGLGIAYRHLSEFQLAIKYHNQCLSIAIKDGDRALEGCNYGHLGSVYNSLGDFRRAIEYHKLHLHIAEEFWDSKCEGHAYNGLGIAYRHLSKFQLAINYHNQCLSIAIKVGDRALEGRTYGHLGGVYNSLGDFPRAIDYLIEDLSIAKEVGNRAEEGSAYCRLGSCYRALHNIKEAIECYKGHLMIAKKIGNRTAEGCAHIGLGHCFFESHSLNEALEHFRCSVKITDTIRASSISEHELKISLRRHYQCAYTHLWQVLVMLQRNDEALYAAERGRAQALLDALKVTYGLTSLSPRSIESEEEVRYISKKTATLTVFLALNYNILSMWVLRKEGNPIFRQEKLKISGSEHEDSFSLLLDNVLKTIGAGRGIRCENRSMDKLSTTTATTRDEHQASEASQETTDCLQPLYDVLIGPIEDLLDGDELIVVPDGALSKAPWAALSETLRIRTVPSLTSLKVITDSPIEYHSKSGALLVGDPCLKKITDKRGNPIYDPLKYARMEVEMIGKILESQPLTGEDATKEAVLQRIGSVALIHIAAHGRKETGEIVLAPDTRWESDTPKEEDCIMKISDIQAVKLRASLVVLSCCHSGQGPVSSEGVVGMARAFLFAGARSVLATLWAIDDEATMMFMKSFYQQLGNGESASVALQKAMKCLRDSRDYSAPKYWAPFVLIGDDVRIEFKKKH